MAHNHSDNSEQAYISFIVQQMHSSLDFLVSQHQLSRPDANLIRNKLPLINPTTAPNVASPPINTSTVNDFANLSIMPTMPTTAPDIAVQNGSQSVLLPTQTSGQSAQASRIMPPPPARPAPTQTHTRRAKALWPYSGNASEDLSFVTGDIILVTEEVNPDWWRGEVAGRDGTPKLFPSNHVELFVDAPSGSPGDHSTNSYDHRTAYNQQQPTYNNNTTTWQPPYGSTPQQSYYQQPPPQDMKNSSQEQVNVAPQQVIVEPKKKNPMGGRLGQAFVGGAGFGAGSAVASNLVNAIL